MRIVYAVLTVFLMVALLGISAPAFAQEEAGTDPPNPDTVESQLREDVIYETSYEMGNIPPATDWREYAGAGELAEYDSLAASVSEDEDRYEEIAARRVEIESEIDRVGALSMEANPLWDEDDRLSSEQFDLIDEHSGSYQRMLAIEAEASESAYAALDAAEEEAAEEEPASSDSSGSSGSSAEPVPETGSETSGGGGWGISIFGVVFLAALAGGAYLYVSKQRALSGRPANEYVENVKRAFREARGAAVATVTEVRKPNPGTVSNPALSTQAPPQSVSGDDQTGSDGTPSEELRKTEHKNPPPETGGRLLTEDALTPRDPFLAQIKDVKPTSTRRSGTSPVSPSGMDTEMALAGGADDGQKSVLQELGFDMVAAAHRGEYLPMVGRQEELDQMVEILMQSTLGNPVIVGEAGTGKTQIVEGFALRLASGVVPRALRDKRLFEIRMSQLTSGTKYRGDFEERMEALVAELMASSGTFILFMDEFHTVMGAGSFEGSPSDATDILKPALARGKATIIGATTAEEYRAIEKNDAMTRRFTRLDVSPLSVEETVSVLRSRVPVEQERHGIVIEPEALEVTARYAERFMSGEYLPGSAIKLLSTAAARVSRVDKTYLTARDVAVTVKRSTGINVGAVSSAEASALRDLGDRLRSRVVGQDEAIEEVATAVRRQRANLNAGRPPSIFLTGPTGVGKTELAKALASELFDDEKALIQIRMSGYSLPEDVTKLTGSAPGYKDSDEGGALTEAVRRKPYSVVLFDEVEKGHENIGDLFLQLVDEGKLDDSRGRTIDFSNCVLLFTSNLAQGTGDPRDELVQGGMRPEIAARFGSVVRFRKLAHEDVREIVALMASGTAKGLKKEYGGNLVLTEDALDFLADRGYDPERGARPAQGAINKYLSNPLSDLVISGGVADRTVTADLSANGDRLVFEVSDITPDDPEKDLPCVSGEVAEDAQADVPESRETARTRPPASWPGME